ncbi:MAG: hypothetical protein ACLUI3_15325 [Christensenellales bacterium]
MPVLLFICDAPPSFADAALNMQIFERTVPVWLYPGMRPDVELLCQRAGALFSGEGALPLCALMLEDARVFSPRRCPRRALRSIRRGWYVWPRRRIAASRRTGTPSSVRPCRPSAPSALSRCASPIPRRRGARPDRALLAVRDPINGGFGKLKQPLCPALRF